MSSQIPVVLVCAGERPTLEARLAAFGAFPVVKTGFNEAPEAIAEIRPAAVLADLNGMPDDALAALAERCERLPAYTPLIVLGQTDTLPHNALPFCADTEEGLADRLSAALRVRTLHMTVLRRLGDGGAAVVLPDHDPLKDATILLVGRGRSFAPLSVAFGERTVVIGALTVEAAAKHLNSRDIDGLVLGDGFSHRIAAAFLTVLAEDVRFRSLPIVVAGSLVGDAAPKLANLELVRGPPERVVAHAIPLVRQQAFAARLDRTLKAMDTGGLIDPSTGLLTPDAFDRDWDKTVADTLAEGGALSAARFTFAGIDPRTCRDAARILERLMRSTDFASLRDDNSIVTAFAATDLRTAHVIARRLAGVLRQTAMGPGKDRINPLVTLATLKPTDTAGTILERLNNGISREAS